MVMSLWPHFLAHPVYLSVATCSCTPFRSISLSGACAAKQNSGGGGTLHCFRARTLGTVVRPRAHIEEQRFVDPIIILTKAAT